MDLKEFSEESLRALMKQCEEELENRNKRFGYKVRYLNTHGYSDVVSALGGQQLKSFKTRADAAQAAVNFMHKMSIAEGVKYWYEIIED